MFRARRLAYKKDYEAVSYHSMVQKDYYFIKVHKLNLIIF